MIQQLIVQFYLHIIYTVFFKNIIPIELGLKILSMMCTGIIIMPN